jgi:glycosyltransferase involved in cell wall biosynthesis
MAKTKFSIITPCFNAENYILETAESILNQTAVRSGRVDLEYIIRDGNSSDRTAEKIQGLKSPYVKLISEPDGGMYDALAKGMKSATGDITAYLNAGDYYHKCAFDIVLDIFEEKKVKWLTGFAVLYSENSYVFSLTLPFKYRKRLFEKGLYGPKLYYVQQESTFWATELHQTLDFEKLKSFKNSGDFYLWHQFATRENLAIVAAYLGGFKYHADSLTKKGAEAMGSAQPGAYNIKEIQELTKSANVFDLLLARFDRLMLHMPQRVKKKLNPKYLYMYDVRKNEWY